MNKKIPSRVLDILEWPVIQEELRKRCQTPTGKLLIDLLSPLDPEGVRARMRKITHLKELLSRGKSPDFSGATDIGPLLDIAEKDGVLKLEELARVRSFTAASGRIIRFLREARDEFPGLAEEHDRFDRLADITDILGRSITETMELSDSAYPELRRLRDEIHSARQEMEKSIMRIIHTPQMDQVLQEKIFTTRNDRCVVLVKSAMKDRVRGTVHDISSSGATYYIEPQEITPLNNRALMLEKKLQAEASRILRVLSQKVSEHAAPLRGNLEAISGLDFLAAASRFSADIRGSEPEITETNEVVLYQARHPILYLMNPGGVVANDINLDASFNCLIISGANTGGKTVLLKTIGLCALFAMLGLHLPAGPDSRVGVFERILADIGDDQSLSQSLSTFSGQIVIINEMLSGADAGTLVIIDEIIVGTNPRQGAALAQAILEQMVETGGRIVVTTHYSELKELPARDPRFRNASVSFDMDTLRPAYRLITGLPGVSYAIEIAENYGLPAGVVSRSRDLLDEREVSMEALIEKMQKFEQELAEKSVRLDEAASGLARDKEKYDELMRLLEKRAQEIKQKEGIEFLSELRQYRDLVKERITGLQQFNMKEAGKAREEIGAIEDSVRRNIDRGKEKLFPGKYAPLDPDTARPGDRVFIMPIEKEGTIESLDPARRQAVLLLGSSIKSTFGFGDLYKPAGNRPNAASARGKEQVKKKKAAPEPAGEIPPVLQTQYNTVDLRGKRVEEGLRAMEQEFDRMVRSGIDTAVVIHGHGTGAMKSAVRENFKTSLYVSGSRPGGPGEGGDGVTVVRLRA